MKQGIESRYKPRHLKISVLFLVFIASFFVFIASMFNIMISSRDIPSLKTSKTFIPLRGSIYSADKLTLATSVKLYKASTNSRLIAEDKKDLFAKVFSIYTGVKQSSIRKKLKAKSYIVLSDKLSAKQAQGIKRLSRKLYKLGVFKTRRSKKGLIYQGISVEESREHRIYPYKEHMTPILGYVQNNNNNNFIKKRGAKGVEKYYNSSLGDVTNGLMSGKKDISSFIIFNRDSILRPQKNGFDIVLNISLDFQIAVEAILSEYKKKLDAQEIIVGVMDSKNGKLIALASSNRFNPSSISVSDYAFLNMSAIEQVFEPGSVIKPIMLAKLLDDGIVDTQDVIKGYNGRFRIKNKVIVDEHPASWFSITNAISQSSNIAMAQLGLKLSSSSFFEYFELLGLRSISGIDVSHERQGAIPSLSQLDNDIYKATLSYGYGLSMNFMQLLKLYSMFANNGKIATPRVVNYIVKRGEKPLFVKTKTRRIVSSTTANDIKSMLITTAQKGTARAVYTEGLEIGAKTGTAQISKKGKYVKEYISSVFGFANDSNRTYTIGVTTFLPKNKYFASQTSAKVFKDVVDEMLNYKYLTINKESL